MKISRVETRQFSLAEGASTLVFLHTDSGITGVGEASSPHQPETLRAAIEEVKPRILGFDPFDVHAIGAALGAANDKTGDGMLLRVRSGVEAACLDAVGKQLGVPVFQLFGGPVRDEVRVCAAYWERPDAPPEDYARNAREIANAGFTAIKFDPFDDADLFISGPALERAVEITSRIRETVGQDVDLIADANGRFTPSEAVRVANALAPFGLLWLEDPVKTDDPDSLAQLASAVDVRLAIGERVVASYSFREVIERQLIDYVQPDCQNVGGIFCARSIALLAESYYMSFALHHSGGPAALAMNAHVAACAPNCAMVELPYPPRPWWNNILKATFEQRGGFLQVPSGPGLGVEYRAELMESA